MADLHSCLGGAWFAPLNEFHAMPLLVPGASYLVALPGVNLPDTVLNISPAKME